MNRLSAPELSAARKAQNYKLLWEQAIPVVKFAISRLVQSGRVDRSYCSDDMYQAAYLAVGATVRSWEPDKVAFSTWIVARAQGAALDYLRGQASGMVGGRDANGRTGVYDEELTPDLGSGIAESLENDQEAQQLLAGWQQLDRFDRNLLALRYGLGVESQTMSEVAQSTGEPLRTTERKLQVALRKLAGFLQKSRTYTKDTEETRDEHHQRTSRSVVRRDGQDDTGLAPHGLPRFRRGRAGGRRASGSAV